MLVCAFSKASNAHETAGAARTRSSPRPLLRVACALFRRGANEMVSLGQIHVARMRRCTWPILRDARKSALLRMRFPLGASGQALMVRKRESAVSNHGQKTMRLPQSLIHHQPTRDREFFQGARHKTLRRVGEVAERGQFEIGE